MLGELRGLMDEGIAVEIASMPGAGKSEGVQGWVEDQSRIDGDEWGISTVMLATQTPVDLLGFMLPARRQIKDPITGDMSTARISEFSRPTWTMSDKGIPLEHYKRALILFDEADKCEADTTKTSAEIRLKRRLGPWGFDPKKVGCVALVNRVEDRSGSGRKFDFIINRQFEFTVMADVEGWRDWALVNGIDPLFVAFASKYPEIVFSNKVPDKQGPFCTPRSLVNLSRVLPKRVDASGKMKVDSIGNEIITGAIGIAAGLQLSAWIKLRHETPDWEDILRDPTGIAIPAKPDAQLMVCYECAHKVDTKTAAKCVAFIKRLPAQFSVTFAKSAVKRNYDLINTTAFMDWVSKNASLLNAIGGAK
jgi:hypothetical protein